MSKVFEFRIPFNTVLNMAFLTGQDVFFRSKTDKVTGTKGNIQVKSQEKEDEDKKLLCSRCNHLITTSSRKIKVAGNHSYFFANPAGEKFDLRCFSDAPGCETKGVPISDFSWFQGYKWTFAFCSNCSIQSGWFYLSPSDNFFGLIREAFVGKY